MNKYDTCEIRKMKILFKKIKHCFLVFVLSVAMIYSNGCSYFVKLEQSQRSLAGPVYQNEKDIDTIETQYLIKEKILEEKYYLSSDENEKFLIREQIVFEAMNIIDVRYCIFFTSQYVRGASVGLVADITSGGLSTAGALTTNGSSRILSGLSAFVIASNSSYSKNFLAEKSLDVILDRMEADRLMIRASILKNMKENTSTYPLGQAVLDVRDYAMAGTLPQALKSLKTDTGNAILKADTLKLQVENNQKQK